MKWVLTHEIELLPIFIYIYASNFAVMFWAYRILRTWDGDKSLSKNYVFETRILSSIKRLECNSE